MVRPPKMPPYASELESEAKRHTPDRVDKHSWSYSLKARHAFSPFLSWLEGVPGAICLCGSGRSTFAAPQSGNRSVASGCFCSGERLSTIQGRKSTGRASSSRRRWPCRRKEFIDLTAKPIDIPIIPRTMGFVAAQQFTLPLLARGFVSTQSPSHSCRLTLTEQ